MTAFAMKESTIPILLGSFAILFVAVSANLIIDVGARIHDAFCISHPYLSGMKE
jgi:hypothetical protein